MTLTRRRFIASTALFGTSAALAHKAAAADAALTFVLLGDWGRKGTNHQSSVAAQLGRTAASLNSAFTVSVGDNFYEDGVTGLDDPHWQESFEQIYTAPSLQSPWKVILGNHDYRGNVQAQLDYSAHSKRWQLPARYWHETHTLPDGAQATLYFLDTSPFIKKYHGSKVQVDGQDTEAQLAWLDEALSRSTSAWNLVIGHHPIYTALDPTQDPVDEHDQPDLIARLLPVLEKHNVPVYICGHDHTLQSIQLANITHIITGAGSQTYTPTATRPGGFATGAHGFMAVSLSSAAFHYSLIDEHGQTLFAQAITRA